MQIFNTKIWIKNVNLKAALVFRKRVSSPGGGGAILIGKDTKKTNQSNSQVLDHVTYESTSSMTDSEASISPGKKTQKRRRRKKRQKTQRKVKRVFNSIE